ncbi:MAG: hypothetical protein OXH76_03765 [Boseongicola sp.]|nr:hypothetical protein [Boseongicola sp.]
MTGGTAVRGARSRREAARKRARGVKRVSLWVRPEHEATLQLAAGQPAALARLRKAAEAAVQAEISEALDDGIGGGAERSPRIRAALAAAVAAKERLEACLDELVSAAAERAGDEARAGILAASRSDAGRRETVEAWQAALRRFVAEQDGRDVQDKDREGER